MIKSKILIVEDNNIVMLELKDRLLDMGYEVVDTALSGLDAVKKADLHRPDLAMMDIRLKGAMDGIEAASIIYKEFDVPVIYLTAHTDEDTLQRAKITEPYGYIIKPFEERELHSTIEMALYKHQVEKNLKENFHWFSATLKSIGDALIATDSSGVVKLINPVAEEISGWNHAEALGRNINEIIKILDEDNKELLENPITISLKNNSIVGAVNKILISKNGNRIPVDYSSAPMKNTNNNQSGAVLVFRDISETKTAKELIEKQKIFLKQIIDTDPNYIYVKDSEGKYELINRAIAEALGVTTEELLGKYDCDYLTSEELEFQRKLEAEVLNSQQEITIPEEKLIDVKGKVHLLQTFKRAINSQNGNEKLVLSVASDITELKMTENTLRETRQQINSLLKAIPDTILRYHRNGIITDYHIPQDCDLFSASHELRGKRIYDIVDENLGEKILLFSEKAIKSSDVQSFEYEYSGNGESIFKEVRIVNNDSKELIIIFRDITGIKTSQSELKSLNASKDKFFSIIAHDLRSPFTSIIGLTEHLVDESDNFTKDQFKVIAENINKSARLTLSLLENLLQWGKIKSGRVTFEPHEIKLIEAVKRSADLYNSSANNKNILIEININPSLKVFADLNMVETILRNLISNSVKFTNPGGKVEIFTEEDKNFVTVGVKDNGIGISENKLNKLFRIYENISTRGTQNEEGSGLGLILCKEFIELNSGTISAESKQGEGSIFSFTLPKKKK